MAQDTPGAGAFLRQEDWTFAVICRAFEGDGKISRRMLAMLKQKVERLDYKASGDMPGPSEELTINRIFASKGLTQPF